MKKEWTSPKSLLSHFQKHCQKQKDITSCGTQEAYLDLANSTITNATKTKALKSGKTNYFNANTGLFVSVGSNDKIITCFKPSSGLKYFNNSY